MKTNFKIAGVLLCCAAFSLSCQKDYDEQPLSDPDKFFISTLVAHNSDYTDRTWYVGTFPDLDIKDYTHTRARQRPDDVVSLVKSYKDFVFVLPYNGDMMMKKYKRQADGSLSDEGGMVIPEVTHVLGMVIESDTKGYISLLDSGKIAVFNPATMQITNYIDLSSYTIGGANDRSPDPTVLLLRNNKLYVACMQKMPMWLVSSIWRAEILIIDLANGNAITSVTDNRTTTAGSFYDFKSMFFDESGDLYVYCKGYLGGNIPAGFLRIKNGQTTFDPTYFFDVANYNVPFLPGNKISDLLHMQYANNGIVYSTGHVRALGGSGVDKVNACFKLDLSNKIISRLDLPYTNGFAGSVLAYQNKIYWGLTATEGVGIYQYDPADGTASARPIITTQGDPFQIEAFE